MEKSEKFRGSDLTPFFGAVDYFYRNQNKNYPIEITLKGHALILYNLALAYGLTEGLEKLIF